MSTFSWREHLPVHPAAELFPLMSPAEIEALAEDIAKNGVVDPIVIWRKDGDSLLDGRNRLDAMAHAGLIGINDEGQFHNVKSGRPIDCHFYGGSDCNHDPYALALSLNVHRRHLTAEQKRDLIADLLKAQPEKSNRQIADQVKVDHKTVGAVRSEKEATGEIPQLGKTTGRDGKARPAKKPKKKSKRFQATVSAAELADELAAALAPETDEATVERDRKTCVALDQKVRAAERESAQWIADHPVEDDAEASAEKRKAQYAAEPADASISALAKFKAAAADILPLLSPAELKAAREYVASDDWLREVPGDLSIPSFLLRDLPASNAS
jgi:hypothetical protein